MLPVQGLTPGSSKEELVWAVQHHFKFQEVRQLAHSVFPTSVLAKAAQPNGHTAFSPQYPEQYLARHPTGMVR